MHPRFEIAAVLCLTAIFSAGCAVTGALLVSDSLQSAAQRSDMQERRLERAAAFHDSGRYYK